MRIVAYDLSLTCCGRASYEDGTVSSDTWSPPGKGVQRLEFVDAWVFLLASDADLVLIEGYSYGSRGRAVVSIGELGGVIRLGLHRQGRRVVEVPPSNLKKYATGKGNANKELVLVEAVKRLGYDGSSNDEADALWLLQMALGHYDLPEAVVVPKVHQTALEKIVWPELVL